MPKGGWLGQCVRKNGYLAQTMRPSRARPLRTNLYGRLDSPMRVTRAAAPPASARGPRTPHPGRAADSRPGELRRASATETRRHGEPYAGEGSEQLGNNWPPWPSDRRHQSPNGAITGISGGGVAGLAAPPVACLVPPQARRHVGVGPGAEPVAPHDARGPVLRLRPHGDEPQARDARDQRLDDNLG